MINDFKICKLNDRRKCKNLLDVGDILSVFQIAILLVAGFDYLLYCKEDIRSKFKRKINW